MEIAEDWLKKRERIKCLKAGANAQYWNSNIKSVVSYERYWMSKKGMRYMNRFRTEKHLVPMFDEGKPEGFVRNEATGVDIPFQRYRVICGQAVLNDIPDGCRPLWNKISARDILHPSIRTPGVCWCYAYPNYPLLNYPDETTRCRCNLDM